MKQLLVPPLAAALVLSGAPLAAAARLHLRGWTPLRVVGAIECCRDTALWRRPDAVAWREAIAAEGARS